MTIPDPTAPGSPQPQPDPYPQPGPTDPQGPPVPTDPSPARPDGTAPSSEGSA